jgi:hypothetical protein
MNREEGFVVTLRRVARIGRKDRFVAAEDAIRLAVARFGHDFDGPYALNLRRIAADPRVVHVCASILGRKLSAEFAQWLETRSPLPAYAHAIDRLVHCAAASVLDSRCVHTLGEIETGRAALRTEAARYHAEALAALRLGDLRGVAAATTHAGIVGSLAADLARKGDPIVVERHAVGKRGKRPRLGAETFEEFERGRGVLAALYAETAAIFGRPAPEIAAAFASAVTGIQLTRHSLRRLQLKAKRRAASLPQRRPRPSQP